MRHDKLYCSVSLASSTTLLLRHVAIVMRHRHSWNSTVIERPPVLVRSPLLLACRLLSCHIAPPCPRPQARLDTCGVIATCPPQARNPLALTYLDHFAISRLKRGTPIFTSAPRACPRCATCIYFTFCGSQKSVLSSNHARVPVSACPFRLLLSVGFACAWECSCLWYPPS